MNQQITGQLSGIEHRNAGWVAVAILQPGKEWPLKLSTKKPELISLAQQMMGQLVTAGYNESESTSINPHSGQPYINRYLEAISMGQVDMVGMPTQIQPQQIMPPQPITTPVMQPQSFQQQQPAYTPPQQPMPQQPMIPQPRQSDAERTAQIHRQSAAKVAAAFLPLLQPEDQNLASLIRISEQLCKYFDQGVQWDVPPVQPQPVQPQANPVNPQPYSDPDGYAYQPPPGDDDIPF